MRRRTKGALVASAAALACTCVLALDSRLLVRRYELASPALSAPVRLALLTDYHSCGYGPGQRELLDALRAQDADLVLLAGDILDDEYPPDHALELLPLLAEGWPCYYVTGNHEQWTGRAAQIKAWLQELGMVVLEGSCQTVRVRTQALALCGVDDPSAGEALWRAQLAQAAATRPEGVYSLLLTHRPERIEAYLPHGFDLVLAGHAHGGQWRLPGLVNGLLAPNQGLFPKYAGGRFALGDTTLVVSRGLARETTRVPRIFNRPELVVLDLLPQA